KQPIEESTVQDEEGRRPSIVKKQVEEHVADQLQGGEVMMKFEDTTSLYNNPFEVTKEEGIHHAKEEEALQQLLMVMDQPLEALEVPTTIVKADPLTDFPYNTLKSKEDGEIS
ncbi:hypothetical protein KI387_041508, partial [Taxus chinensis]